MDSKLEKEESDFIESIDIVHHETHPFLRFQPQAKSIVAKTLRNFNIQLINSIKDYCRNESSDHKLSIEGIEKVLQPMMTNNLFRHAIHKGQQQVNSFQKGELSYTPGFKHWNRISTDDNALMKDYISDFTAIFHHHLGHAAPLNKDIRNYSCYKLDELTTKLIEETAKFSRVSGEVTPVELKQAVDTVFGPNLAEHAHSEGMKMVFSYLEGLLLFRPSLQEITRFHNPDNVDPHNVEPPTLEELYEMRDSLSLIGLGVPTVEEPLIIPKEEPLLEAKRTQSELHQLDMLERGLDLMMHDLGGRLERDTKEMIADCVYKFAVDIAANIAEGDGPITKEAVSESFNSIFPDGQIRRHAAVVGERAISEQLLLHPDHPLLHPGMNMSHLAHDHKN